MSDRMGLVGLAIFIIAVSGLFHFVLGTWAIAHRDNPLAQASTRFFPI
jgi:hypothetical protein